MKVALLYSGLPNLTEKILSNHSKFIFDHYDCDIYLSTYDDDYDNFLNTKTFLDPYKYETDNLSTTRNNIFNSIIPHIKNKKPETKILNTLSMFYKIEKVFDLIDNSINYDSIIRIRLDITFDKPLILAKNLYLNVPQGGDYGGLLDLFAYGSYDTMSKYCKLYRNIINMLNDGCVFHPETMLKFYCDKIGLQIHRFPYNIYLRDNLFTK